MKKHRSGALFLSLALALTVATPVTAGAVYAAETLSTASSQALLESESRDLGVEALEKSYEEILKSDAVYNGADHNGKLYSGSFKGSNTGGGVNYWSEQDINPAFDDVTVSATFVSKSPSQMLGFGFRFTLQDENGTKKHVTLVRMLNRILIVQCDGLGAGKGTVEAKFYADSYLSDANMGGAANPTDLLSSFVNNGQYEKIKTTSDDSNGTEIIKAKGLCQVRYDGGVGTKVNKSELSFNIALRKVTKTVADEKVVQFRYYEKGQYLFAIEFKDEVIGYAPNRTGRTGVTENDRHGTFYFDENSYQVTLGNDSYEYVEKLDQRPESTALQLAVGESVKYEFNYAHNYKNGSGEIFDMKNYYPAMSFVYGEDVIGVYRYDRRIAIAPFVAYNQRGTVTINTDQNGEPITDQNGKVQTTTTNAPNKNIYIDTSVAGTAAGNTGYATKGVAAVTATGGGKNLLDGDTYRTTAYGLAKANKIIYTITRLGADAQVPGYDMYLLQETQDSTNTLSIAKLGFPVSSATPASNEIAKIRGFSWGGPSELAVTFNERPATMQTQLNNLKTQKPTTAEFSEKYAQTTDSAVRFLGDTKGLRFKATASKEAVEGYKALYGESNVSFGVKLVREDGAYAYIDAVHYTETDSGYQFNGVVSRIDSGHYGTKYTPYVYIKYTDSGTDHYVLTAAGEAKSISEVAQELLNDYSSVKSDKYRNQVTINGQTVYSPYLQSMIDLLEDYAAG